MKLIKKLFATLGLTLILVISMIPVVSAEGNYNQVDTNYETISYDSNVVLDKSDVYHIEEKIKVNFLNDSHGIYRYIPYLGSMQYKDGESVKESKYRGSIKNVKVNGYEFDKEYIDGNLVLKIGDPDKLVSGEQEYVISFDFDAGDDKISAYDRVYINLIPTGWRTAIQKSSFKLTIPKEIAQDKILLYAGTMGNMSQSKFRGTVEGNVLSAEAVEPLAPFEGATVYAEAEEGYFVNERTDMPLIILMWILIGLIPLLAIILYLIFGIDKPIIKVMSVSAPKGMTPAEVGYIMDSTVDNKDVLSLIIYWADKGYLTIQHNEEDDSFTLTKLSDLPLDANGYEKTMFDGLFNLGDVVKTNDLKSTFYTTLELTKTRLRNKFSSSKKTSLYTASSRICQGIIGVLSIVPIVIAMLLGGYISIASAVLYIPSVILSVILLGIHIAVIAMSTRWYVMSKKSRIWSIVGASIGGVLVYGILIALALWQLSSILPVIAAILGSILALGLTCVMPKRTQQCNDWFGELLGLRDFIELAEKERIEMLVNEDPSYFYSILPYAYVLGVSDTWSKKFENIAIEPPTWYYGGGFNMGNFSTYLFLSSFNHCMTNMNQTLSVPPVQVDGSKFGGISGGGGGGFSGGGFSGGGGGSW